MITTKNDIPYKVIFGQKFIDTFRITELTMIGLNEESVTDNINEMFDLDIVFEDEMKDEEFDFVLLIKSIENN